jgi:hypothetical protein
LAAVRKVIEFILINVFLLVMALVSVAICIALIKLIESSDLADWLLQPLYALTGALSIMLLYLSWKIAFDRLKRIRAS